jgi:hypothetical protein
MRRCNVMFFAATIAGVSLPVLLSAAHAGQPKGWERGPACREPTVVDEMTREIRAQDYYTHVDPALVTEQPTNRPNVVQCQVCVEVAPYDARWSADQPIRQCIEHGFEVRILPAGFVVRDLW